MTDVKVGDIYLNTFRNCPEPFVVTSIKKNIVGISRKGTITCVLFGNLKPHKYKLIAHYDTWVEAVNSPEFRGEK